MTRPEPLSHPCKSKHCRAQRDEPCRTRTGQPCPPHAKRKRAAQRVADLLPGLVRDGLPVAGIVSVSASQLRIACPRCGGVHVAARTPAMARDWSRLWPTCGGSVMVPPLVQALRW